MIAPLKRLGQRLGRRLSQGLGQGLSRWWPDRPEVPPDPTPDGFATRLPRRLAARLSAWVGRLRTILGGQADATAATSGDHADAVGRAARVDPVQGDAPDAVIPFTPAPSATHEPARTLEGSVRISAGWIAMAPMTVPQREYLLRLPAGYEPGRRWPLMVWIHGCQQSPEEFRDGTRIADHADAAGMVLLMPRQTRAANPMRCWNWFDRGTARGEGEVALVLAQIDKVIREHSIEPTQVAVAGLSSGAALAVALTVNAPDRIRALISVAGLACGIAGPLDAVDIMRSGPRGKAPPLPARRPGRRPAELAALVVQGSADTVVAPAHAEALARQLIELEGGFVPLEALPFPTARSTSVKNGRTTRVTEFRAGQAGLVRLMQIEGMSHAWPGGDPRFDYQDPTGPDLSAEAVAFAAAAFARPSVAGASAVTWTSVWRRRRRA